MRAPAGSPTRCSVWACARATASRCWPITVSNGLEIYAAAAKAGLVAVPINFRLVGPRSATSSRIAKPPRLIVQDDLLGPSRRSAAMLSVPVRQHDPFRREPAAPPGYRAYEDLIAAASDRRAGRPLPPNDPWTLMYTSGTTGKPKGAIRSHRARRAAARWSPTSNSAFSGATTRLLVMPMCHANSLYFFGAFAYLRRHGLGLLAQELRSRALPAHSRRAANTFTSLVPTQYVMMLDLPHAVRERPRLRAGSRS